MGTGHETWVDALTNEVVEQLGSDSFHATLDSLRLNDNKKLPTVIRDLLEPLFEKDEAVPKTRLARTRLVFETTIAKRIAHDPLMKKRVEEEAVKIQDQMVVIARKKKVSAFDCNNFWQADGEFHALLGTIAGFPQMRRVVKQILDKFGVPTNRTQMQEICVEHLAILDSITAEYLDDERIILSIRQHIQRSLVPSTNVQS